MKMKEKGSESGGGGALVESCKKPSCAEPKAEDSVYCIRHRDLKRAGNAKFLAKKAGKTPGRPAAGRPRRAAVPAPSSDGPYATAIEAIERELATLTERIDRLKAARAALVGS